MSYYGMGNKELSQLVRKTLKEHGFTSKDVSVRVSTALHDTAVSVTVKNPLVRLSEVEAVARTFSEVEYDERSMEILAGCNVYVHCQYECGIFDDIAEELLPVAREVFNNEKWDGRKIAQNERVKVDIVKISESESRLYEFDKGEEIKGYVKGYIIRSAKDLAVAMWRFKNIGTIYA